MKSWRMFSHELPPSPGGKATPPFLAVHLTAPDGGPDCAMAGATAIELSRVPKGFVLACLTCLEATEVPS